MRGASCLPPGQPISARHCIYLLARPITRPIATTPPLPAMRPPVRSCSTAISCDSCTFVDYPYFFACYCASRCLLRTVNVILLSQDLLVRRLSVWRHGNLCKGRKSVTLVKLIPPLVESPCRPGRWELPVLARENASTSWAENTLM